MKIAIDIGHNAPIDTGAVGIRREDKMTADVGQRLTKILIENGHYVVETCPSRASTVTSSLQSRVSVANRAGVDIFVSIHFNAANFRAHGAECYAVSKVGAGIARSILEEITDLGFYNRGVKRAPFYVLKHTTMPAVLVECCFCDSNKDMNLYHPDLMAKAIAEGLIGQLPDNRLDLRTLRVNNPTWLKASTEQARYLSSDKKHPIEKGKYQLNGALPEEESHYWVRLNDGKEGFIYSGHADLS